MIPPLFSLRNSSADRLDCGPILDNLEINPTTVLNYTVFSCPSKKQTKNLELGTRY